MPKLRIHYLYENKYPYSRFIIKVSNLNFKFNNKTDPLISFWKVLVKKRLEIYKTAFSIKAAKQMYIADQYEKNAQFHFKVLYTQTPKLFIIKLIYELYFIFRNFVKKKYI